MPTYLWNPPPTPSLPIRGRNEHLPVNRLYFVGRNYHAHALEMGRPVDRSSDRAFYFTKSPTSLVLSGATVPYPPETSNFHHEMELVVVVGKAGFRIPVQQAHDHIFGYAVGLDMTRRDLQFAARDKGRPWDLSKDIESGSVISEVVAMPGVVLTEAAISLEVNGQTRQSSNIDKLIWNIPEILADLSLYYHLQAGDLIYTGTPEGVGPVVPGDHITGRVVGVSELELTIGPAE